MKLSIQSQTTLWAIRCEYISTPHKLTKKGRGYFSPPVNRLIYSVWCWISPERRTEMVKLLQSVHKQHVEVTLAREGRLAEL